MQISAKQSLLSFFLIYQFPDIRSFQVCEKDFPGRETFV